MSKIKLISIIIGILVVGAGAYFFLRTGGGIFSEVEPPAGGSTSPDLTGEQSSENQPTPDNPGANPLTPQKSTADEYAGLLQERGKIYEDFDVFFRFLYPPDFDATEIDDEKGYTILIQNAAKDSAFQIFMYPFDLSTEAPAKAGEPWSLTPERVRKDLPNLKIEAPQQILIGAEKDIKALLFFSEDQTLGKTLQVWFVGNGHLFQVEGYADQDSLMGPVLSTWQFLPVE